MLALVAVFAGVVLFDATPARTATTYVVDTTSDANLTACTAAPADCSLRGAINAANGNAGADIINFTIPGTGPHTISPGSNLPDITEPLVIDGYTEPGSSGNTNGPSQGSNAVLKIELNGAGAIGYGLRIIAGSTTIRGLAINRFSTGIVSFTNGSNVIEGNFIGTDITGALDRGNVMDGVLLFTGGNTIGGTAALARNVISGTDNGSGVTAAGSVNGGNNVIQGNLIGLNAAGSAVIANTSSGVYIQDNSGNIVGGTTAAERNVLSGNGLGLSPGAGVDIGGTNNTVRGNYIGTDVGGTVDLGNVRRGILINGGAGNTVGGTAAGAGNVISGNDAEGISIASGATGNVVHGNLIGTNATGTAALGNTGFGVQISASSNNTVGGTAAGTRNVIAGNGTGLAIGSGSGNAVEGNYIGTDITGTVDLGNAGEGVQIHNSANNSIGGTAAGARNVISGNNGQGVRLTGTTGSGNEVTGNYIGTAADGVSALGNTQNGVLIAGLQNNAIGLAVAGGSNIIAHNGGDGVEVSNLGTTGNSIRSNSMYANTGAGIANVTGGNDELAPPTVSSVGPATGTACASCIIDIYSDSADEGRVYEGSAVADGGGAWTYVASVDGPNITATATDAIGNTSQFSGTTACGAQCLPTPLESVSGKIGPAGGSLNTGGSDLVEAVLTVPAGGLWSSTIITVDAYATSGVVPPAGGGNYLSRAYGFRPAGTTFTAPAVVQINYANVEVVGMNENALGAWIYSALAGWQLAPIIERNVVFNFIKVQVPHFSVLVIGDLDSSDYDGDGCTEYEESQDTPGTQMSGGLRDFSNPYDYFNPTGDGKNRIDDVLAVIGRYFASGDPSGPLHTVPPAPPAYHANFDRAPLGPDVWDLTQGDGQILLPDILAIVKQYFHDCS